MKCLYFVCFLVTIPSCFAGRSDIEAMIDGIINSYETEVFLINEGKGEAEVETFDSEGKVSEKSKINFWFKNDSVRTDFWEDEDGEGRLHHNMAYNGEALLRHNMYTKSASIKKPGRGFIGSYGEDFSPSVFFQSFDRPLTSVLNHWKQDEKGELYMNVHPKGLIEIGIKHEYDKQYGPNECTVTGHSYVLVNPDIGFRLVELYEESINSDSPDSKVIQNIKCTWGKYGADIYPSEFEYKSVVNLPGRQINSSQHFKAEIKQFTSDITIGDEIFTLGGMGLIEGTRVNDKVIGTSYEYGSMKISELELEELALCSGLIDISENEGFENDK